MPWLVGSIVALSGLALLLRLLFIDQESLWEDEGYTLLFARLPLGRLITVAGAHEHPPLYYLLVHLVLTVKGSYLAPRLISAVAGALCVPAVYRLGQRLFAPTVGLVAAGITTLSPFQLWHSQNGRGYALACLLVLLSYVFLFEALNSSSRYWWPAYGLATILALYTEYTTALVLLPQAVALFLARSRGSVRPLIATWIAAVLVFLPWLGVVLGNTRRVLDENYWIPTPSVHGVSSTALKFLGLMTDAPTMKPLVPYEVPMPLVTGHEVVALCLVAALSLTVLAYAWSARNTSVLILALWLLAPFAAVLLLSPIRSLYVDRIFLDASFPFYLLVAWVVWIGWTRHRALLPATGLLALMITGSVAADQHLYAVSDNPDWRTPMRDLRAHYHPGQAVVLYPGILGTVLPPYRPTGWHPTRELELWTGTYLDVSGLSSSYARLEDIPLRNRLLSQSVADARQVWLVCDDYVGLWQVRRWFKQHGYRLRTRRSYRGWSDIELWARG